MSINSTSLSTLLQTLSSIPNVGGNGIPVSQYATTERSVLQAEMESVPNRELTTLGTTNQALGSLQTALQQLQSATQTLASQASWSVINVTSSNTSAFTVSGGQGAPLGNYPVTVQQLAQTQVDVSSVSQTTATGASTFTGGTFYISSGATSTAIGITVTSGESLQDIVSSVNSETQVTDVQAFILGNNQLAFESTQSGSAGAFSLTDASGTNFITSQAAVTMTETPVDAQITLGGVTVTSSSNNFGNVIPGVTLTVVASGTGSLSVTTDSGAAVTAVQNWMSAYNSVIDVLHADTLYAPASGTSAAQTGPLMGDAVASGLLSALPNAVNAMVPASGTNALQSLAAVGIVVDPNTGHLEFQSSSGFQINGKTVGASLQDGQTMFENAISTDPTMVQSLFGVVQGTTLKSVLPSSGVLGNMNDALNQFLGFGSTTGIIATEQKSIQTQTTGLNQYLTQLDQMINARVTSFTAQLNALNAALSKSQSQMQTLSAMFKTSSSSSSSSGG